MRLALLNVYTKNCGKSKHMQGVDLKRFIDHTTHTQHRKIFSHNNQEKEYTRKAIWTVYWDKRFCPNSQKTVRGKTQRKSLFKLSVHDHAGSDHRLICNIKQILERYAARLLWLDLSHRGDTAQWLQYKYEVRQL